MNAIELEKIDSTNFKLFFDTLNDLPIFKPMWRSISESSTFSGYQVTYFYEYIDINGEKSFNYFRIERDRKLTPEMILKFVNEIRILEARNLIMEI